MQEQRDRTVVLRSEIGRAAQAEAAETQAQRKREGMNSTQRKGLVCMLLSMTIINVCLAYPALINTFVFIFGSVGLGIGAVILALGD